ncbi:heterokaryon incompatibility protein-domain-containing protein [Xylaria telfairii]|nr:heterokaryon incompatibility protein-domain-containing protein [Xylaria telfairii]
MTQKPARFVAIVGFSSLTIRLGVVMSYSSSDGPGESKFLVFNKEDKWRYFETGYRIQDVYPDLPSVAQSALEGCICCAQIREAILAAKLEPPEGAVRVLLLISYLWKTQGNDLYDGDWVFLPDRGFSAMLLQVNFMSATSQEPLSRPVISFNIDSSSVPCVTWLRLETSPEYDATTPRNIAWIKGFLREFEQEAASSRVERDARFLPTRLIDLGVDSQGQFPRLALSTHFRNAETRLEYAALSYCWGPPAEAGTQYRTTRETLRQRLAQIDIARTTPVIKDAAEVCKALGIRYLWVDAVCIIQDDKVDWEKEAAQMSDVYRNSSFTICPVSSSSCSQGFLKKRSPGINIPFRSRVNPDIAGHYTLRCSVPNTTSYFSSGHPATEDLAEAIWETRAWTFQEFHLSRVLLIFGKRKIHIISGKGCISEGETEYTTFGLPVAGYFERFDITNEEDLDREWIYNHWMHLTSTYAMRELTYATDSVIWKSSKGILDLCGPLATDKFPALSGLAIYFHGLLGVNDQYLAGLWLKDLHRQLFWMVPKKERQTFDESFGPQRSGRQFIAPSWSWANQGLRFENGHRYFHTNGSYADYRSEYVSVEPYIEQCGTGVNLYGQIKNASLTITSRIKRILLPPERFYDDVFNDPLWQIKDLEGCYLADCNIDWDEENNDSYRELDLLLLGSCIERVKNGPFGKDKRYAWGLIIHPTPRDENGLTYIPQCYRVGIFYSKPKGQGGLSIFEGCENKTVCLI